MTHATCSRRPRCIFLQFQELCAKWLHEIFFVNQSEEYLKHNSQALNGLQVNDFLSFISWYKLYNFSWTVSVQLFDFQRNTRDCKSEFSYQ